MKAEPGGPPDCAGNKRQDDRVRGEVEKQLLRGAAEGKRAGVPRQLAVKRGGEPQDRRVYREDHAKWNGHRLSEMSERKWRSKQRQIAEAGSHRCGRPAADRETVIEA